MKRPTRALSAALLLALSLVAALAGPGAATTGRHPGGGPPATKQPVATGTGGAIATVDLDASAAGLEVLRRGGNAVDAAVAAAATLGVTEGYSAGIGGGGFMVLYQARTHRVTTIDGRETAPAAFAEDSFIDPATGEPIPFAERVTSGLGVGVPGTLATWRRALRDYGTLPLGKALVRIDRADDHVDRVLFKTLEFSKFGNGNQPSIDIKRIEALAPSPVRHIGMKAFARFDEWREHLEHSAFRR